MAKKHEWKTRALETVAPRLVIGAYRDVISTISGLETIFSIEELLKGLKAGFEDFTKLDPVTLDIYRCVKISPTVVDSLVDAGLLKKRDDGRFRKVEDFEDFWNLTKKVRTSVERAIRWGAYNITARKRGTCSFSPDELVDVLTASQQEIVEILNRIAVYREGKWRRILQKNGSIRTIIERPERRSTYPSVIKDASQKILYALSLFYESENIKIETEKIVGKIRSVERQNIEKFLTKLHFEKHGNLWSLPVETANTPSKLIEDIEKPGRLPPGQADYDCLRLLDSAHLSATEIVGLTGIDKSTISRALKRLSDEDLVELTGKKGRFGEIYYTTLCGNCWLGRDKEECKDELIADIEKVLKSRGLRLANVNWNEFSNQVLNQLAQNLAALEVEKMTKQDVREFTTLWDTLLKPKLDEIMHVMEKRAVGMAGKQGWIDEERIYELVDEKGKALPLLYFLGIKHVMESKQIRQGLEAYFREKAKPVAGDKGGKRNGRRPKRYVTT